MPVAGLKPKTALPKTEVRKPGAKMVIRQYDSNRRPLPTEYEIQEGRAYQRLQRNPEDEDLQDEYKDAFNALWCNQNRQVPIFRCSVCCVGAYGRVAGQPCGYCSAILVRFTDQHSTL